MANIFHARCVIRMMSVYSLVITREYGKGTRDAQSRNEKWIYFMLSNNKFLGKCWYGGHPWIRLAMESESNGGTRNKLYFLFGNRLWCIYHGKCWMLQVIFVGRKSMPLKNNFISQFKLWALALLQIPTSLHEGPFFYLCNFYFEFESPSSLIKHQLRGTMIVFEHLV